MRTKILFLGPALLLLAAAARAQQPDAPPPPPPIVGEDRPAASEPAPPAPVVDGPPAPQASAPALAPVDLDAPADQPVPPPAPASKKNRRKPAHAKKTPAAQKPDTAVAGGQPAPEQQPPAQKAGADQNAAPVKAAAEAAAEPRNPAEPQTNAQSPAVAPPGTATEQPATPQGEQAYNGHGELRMPKSAAEKGIQVQPGTPEEYTIVKGDTLWDLSQKFLNNAWYWPKIWSQNPGIENPHWIYPGNKLRIIPGAGPQEPARVEVAIPGSQQPEAQPQAQNEPVPEPEAEPVPEPAEPPDVAVVKTDDPRRQTAEVSTSGKLAFTPRGTVQLYDDGLVSQDELRNAGSLDASFEQKELLALYDTGYVRFRKDPGIKVGDRLILFHPEGEIVQPVTHRVLGARTKTVGEAKVVAWDGHMATIVVTNSAEEIERGDRARLWTDPMLHVVPKANAREVSGVIVTSIEAGLTTLGEANRVYIDKGEADGVEVGNTFEVVRKGDGLGAIGASRAGFVAGAAGMRAADVKTPEESIGRLLVVAVKNHLSSAVVMRSYREMEIGDRVEMRPSGAGGP